MVPPTQPPSCLSLSSFFTIGPNQAAQKRENFLSLPPFLRIFHFSFDCRRRRTYVNFFRAAKDIQMSNPGAGASGTAPKPPKVLKDVSPGKAPKAPAKTGLKVDGLILYKVSYRHTDDIGKKRFSFLSFFNTVICCIFHLMLKTLTSR